jgi:PiT family inorganic phosphate transporter
MGSKITKVTSFEGVAAETGCINLVFYRTFKNTGKYNAYNHRIYHWCWFDKESFSSALGSYRKFVMGLGTIPISAILAAIIYYVLSIFI